MIEKWKKKFLLVAVIISVTSAAPTTYDSSYRLPKSVVPYSYELSYTTAVHNQGFTNFGGEISIGFDVLENTDVIVLHIRGLSINGTPKLTNSQAVSIDTFHQFDEERDFLIFNTVTTLTNGTYYLDIQFTGKLKTTAPNGFYRSQYQVAGETEPRY